jgi:hypothetical protein
MERHAISPQSFRTTQIVKRCCHIRHEIAISANGFIPVPISDARPQKTDIEWQRTRA